MPTLIENLNLINSYKSDIKSAIEDKGVDMTAIPFSGYAEKIGEIQGGGGFTSDEIATRNYTMSRLNTDAGFVVSYAFDGCSSLEVVHLNECSEISTYAFRNTGLTTLYLGYSGVCNMSNIDTLINSPLYEDFEGLSCYIYVPPSLIVDYQNHQIWGEFKSNLRPMGYYIYWEPSDITGTFTINDTTFDFSSYDTGWFGDYSGIITSSAFEGNTDITLVITNASNIQAFVFRSCTSLIEAKLDGCTDLGMRVFQGCVSLETVIAQSLSTIGAYQFYQCYALKNADFPLLKSCPGRTFWQCYALSYVSLPEVTFADQYAFYACSALKNIYLPKCSGLSSYAFRDCVNLESVSFPVLERIEDRGFERCKFSSINLPSVNYIGNSVFLSCTLLSDIYLGASSVCTLLSSTAFRNTKITNSTGSILVPASLVNAYKTADNWSYFKNRIFQL